MSKPLTFHNKQGILKLRNRKDMLEFCKKVLTKVSFDRMLFTKELQKAINWVSKEELSALRDWCLAQFGSRYSEEIHLSFQRVAIG